MINHVYWLIVMLMLKLSSRSRTLIDKLFTIQIMSIDALQTIYQAFTKVF